MILLLLLKVQNTKARKLIKEPQHVVQKLITVFLSELLQSHHSRSLPSTCHTLVGAPTMQPAGHSSPSRVVWVVLRGIQK